MATVKLAVNAVGFAPGGGLTYLLSQAHQLQRLVSDWNITFFVAPRCHDAVTKVAGRRSCVVVPFANQPSYLRRLWWEQVHLPDLLVTGGFTALYSIGGFAVFQRVIPQLLLNANALHHAGIDVLGLSPLWARCRVERFLALASARRADRLVFVSDAFARSMMSVGFPEPNAIIPSGVSIDLPEPAPLLPKTLQCVPCQNGSFVIAIHNWYRHKDLPWLMRTWAHSVQLSERHLVIVGSPADRSTARQIRHLIEEVPLSGRVHLLEQASRVDVATLLSRAALYVSASRSESFGLTPLEAMSFGLPCVLSDIGPHREVAGEAAMYFEPGNENQLENAVRRAYSERSLAVARGHTQVQRYSWEANVKRLVAELETMVDESVRHHR